MNKIICLVLVSMVAMTVLVATAESKITQIRMPLNTEINGYHCGHYTHIFVNTKPTARIWYNRDAKCLCRNGNKITVFIPDEYKLIMAYTCQRPGQPEP